jgi:hypothetical protein
MSIVPRDSEAAGPAHFLVRPEWWSAPRDARPGSLSGDLDQAVRRAGSRAFRLLGAATARYRPDPDFLLIGAKRGGTTSLYYDILTMRGVLTLFPSARWLPKANETKGTHFFDTNYFRGEAWYRSYLPTHWARQRGADAAGGRVVVGEASPYYLFHPLAAERAAATVPDVKLIAILRDPVMRTYSHWKERRRNNAESLAFPDAIAAEEVRLAGEEERLRSDPQYYSYPHEQQSYIAQSRYARALRPWVQRFGRERLLVLISEEYHADPGAGLAQVADFLGIERPPVTMGRHLNAASGADLDPALRTELRALFDPDVRELEDLLGRRLPWR